MFKFLKVTGNSLSPFFLPDDYVLLLKRNAFSWKISPGDIIAFIYPEIGLLIKEVISFDKLTDEILVQGTHPSSFDSKHFGPISRKDVIGKVIWHIKNPSNHSPP